MCWLQEGVVCSRTTGKMQDASVNEAFPKLPHSFFVLFFCEMVLNFCYIKKKKSFTFHH